MFYLLPVLHVLALLGLDSFYLLYTGAPILMRVPADRALAFTGALIAIGLVFVWVVAALIGALVPVPGPTEVGEVGSKIGLPDGVASPASTISGAPVGNQHLAHREDCI